MSERVVEIARANRPPGRPRDPVGIVVFEVREATGITNVELASPDRRQKITRARQLVCYLARRLTRATCADIAGHLGDRDHTTILYGVKQVERALERGDKTVRGTVDDLVKRIEGALEDPDFTPEWVMEIVDQDPEGQRAKSRPVLRVTYRRANGATFSIVDPMTRHGPEGIL